MIKLHINEEFREITVLGNLQRRYAISNYGRLMSFTDDSREDGRILVGSDTEGYRTFHYRYRLENNKLKNKCYFLYRLVAEYFLPKTSDEQEYVLHLDYNKKNDHINNLCWATKDEMFAHQKGSPHVKKALLKRSNPDMTRKGLKLTPTEVIHIKKMLANPNRKTRMKMIAKQFGISEMQLYRIKVGENWGHIKV